MTVHFKKYFLGYLAVLLVLGSFVLGHITGLAQGKRSTANFDNATNASGTLLHRDAKPPAYLSNDVDFRLFWDVWKLLKDRYVDAHVRDTELFYGALSGVLASLHDPYSVFLDPEVNQKFTDELSGEFSGVGMEIGIKKEQLVVIAPLPETPASRAGLRSGDRILAIDKTDTTGMTIDVAIGLIRGKSGSTVTLLMHRNGWEAPRDIAIVRARITIPSARFTMKDDIAVIRLTHFNADTTAKFRNAVRMALLKNPKGLILDLRNNPGGFLDTAIDVASEWVNDANIVTEKFRNGKNAKEHHAQGRARLATIPTVILVNEGSASASEIVAGALKDYGLATILGKKTFGKGSVQEVESLPDGSAVKFTVAKWFTPKGNSIDENGVIPDFVIDLTENDFDNNRDPQLDAAIKFLHGEKIESQHSENSKS